MRFWYLVVLGVTMVVSCTTIQPSRDPSDDALDDTTSPMAVEEGDQSPTATEIARRVELSLDSELMVPRGIDGPMVVILADSTALGVAHNAGQLVAWQYTDEGHDIATVLDAVEILSFDAITAGSAQALGFRARLRADVGEIDLFVLPTLSGQPFVATTDATATVRTEVKDVDGNGDLEMIHYALVFEAAGRRELIVDLLEWDGETFTHRASVPLVRRLNDRLKRLGRELSDVGPADITRFDAALVPIEGAPVVGDILPVEEVRIPQVNELMVDLGENSWRIFHEIALFPGPAIYRVEIELHADPIRSDPVRIIGLD